ELSRHPQTLLLSGASLLTWLARWGATRRLEVAGGKGNDNGQFSFHGELADLAPHLEELDAESALTNRFLLSNGETRNFQDGRFFAGLPPLVLIENTFYLLRNAPPPTLIGQWSANPVIPIRKLSRRLLTH